MFGGGVAPHARCAFDGKMNVGATGETFAHWRVRVRAEVLDALREVLDGDRRRRPDPRKRDLGKPERPKRPRAV
jgi:hypothetical protein